MVKGLWSWHHQPQALVTFGPPLALLLFGLSAALEIGLLGRRLEEDEREWWARVGALFLLAATFWVLLFFAVLYVPWLIDLAGDTHSELWLKSGLTIGWLVTSVSRRRGRSEPGYRKRQRNLQHFEGTDRRDRPLGLRRWPAGRDLDAGGVFR